MYYNTRKGRIPGFLVYVLYEFEIGSYFATKIRLFSYFVLLIDNFFKNISYILIYIPLQKGRILSMNPYICSINMI